MDIIFVPLLSVILTILKIYGWCVWGMVIMNWLEMFQIINRYNRYVYTLYGFLFRITEPALLWIRQFIPDIRGMDLSPLILILAIFFLESIIIRILIKFPA